MRCAVSSGSGQLLVRGQLLLQTDPDGNLRLNFQTERGRIIEGGTVAPDGDLTTASKDLFRQFFLTWGVSGITLTAAADTNSQ